LIPVIGQSVAFRWSGVVAVAFLFAGCAGYKLGDGGELPFRSVHVAPPVNNSLAPQAAALLGAAIINDLERSGRLSIASESAAEAKLSVTITDLAREISAEQAADTALARKWRVTLTARCSLVNSRTGQVYFQDREVSAFDEVYVDSGFVAAEYQNIPVLTGKLADAVAHEVLAVW
jgi:hypothetical protein